MSSSSPSRESEVPTDAVDSDPHLQRGLSIRHIQMIALGGAIGVGLFMYSGKAIQLAGPALLLCYLAVGIVAFLVMRALGELSLYRPVSGSFAAYAREFVGPKAGFFAGWTYWAQWVVCGVVEPTVIGMYINKYWFSGIPQWATAVAVLIIFYLLNLLTVRLFGESEFWFSILKIIAIIAIIAIGSVVLAFGVTSLGDTASVSNLWSHGGFFPEGALGPLIALQFAIFAFFGVELVGVAAGEAENPDKTIPKAINSVARGIVIFYLGALLVIMSLVAWTEFGADHSPFVLVFQRIGLPAAALVINIVVLSAAMSAGNSNLFAAGRMLHATAEAGQAPSWLTRISRNGVPARAVTMSMLLMLVGVSVNYIVPDKAFLYVQAVSVMGGLMAWSMIMIAHLGYLRAVKAGHVEPSNFRLPGAPYTNYFVLGFLALVAVMLGFDEQSKIALYIAPFWIAGVFGSYWLSTKPELYGRFRKQSAEARMAQERSITDELEAAVQAAGTDPADEPTATTPR